MANIGYIASSEPNTPKDGELQGRWFQLIIGIICMVMIANLQ